MAQATTQRKGIRWAFIGVLFIVGIPGALVYRAIHQEQVNHALLEAVRNEDEGAARSALDAGATPDLRGNRVDMGRFAPSFFDMIRDLFVKPSPIPGRVNRKPTATLLMLSEELGASDIAKLLLERGAHPDLPQPTGTTPLMAAATRGEVDVIDALLEHGANVNARSKTGLTPVAYAIMNNRVQALKTLLQHGASLNLGIAEALKTVDQFRQVGGGSVPGAAQMRFVPNVFMSQRTANTTSPYTSPSAPLILSLKSNTSGEMVQTLLAAGCDARAADQDGTPTLVLVERTLHGGGGPLAAQILGTLKALIVGGADVNAAGPNGETPLSLAASSGSADAVRLLFAHGAKMPKETGVGWSPLMGAAQIGSLDTVRLLLEHGADARATDQSGRTTIMAAVDSAPYTVVVIINGVNQTPKPSPVDQARLQRIFDIIRLLLDHGADLNARDSRGFTALQLAIGANFPRQNQMQRPQKPELVAFLKRLGAKP
jgi:ankyrin repeat protein